MGLLRLLLSSLFLFPETVQRRLTAFHLCFQCFLRLFGFRQLCADPGTALPDVRHLGLDLPVFPHQALIFPLHASCFFLQLLLLQLEGVLL